MDEFQRFHETSGFLNPELSEYLLLHVKMVLDKHNIPFLLMFGTLLGAYRDKAFIPYDRDIDIALSDENIQDVKRIISSGEFSIYQISVIRNALHKNLLSLRYRNDYIDFCFFQKRYDGYWYNEKRIDLWQIDNGLSEIEFLREKFKAVNNIEALLEKCYGNTWKTKIENYPANEKF